MNTKSGSRSREQFALPPHSASLLAQAERALGRLELFSLVWPPWAGFAHWPLVARAAVLETRHLGFSVDLASVLALEPDPEPTRPPRGLRWACGLVLARRKMADLDALLTPSLVADIFYNLDAPQLARGYLSDQEVNIPPSGAPVWTLAPRLAQSGLPGLMVLGLVLVTWQHQAPEHAHRDPAGWLLLSGLADRLGIPGLALGALAPVLESMAEQDYAGGWPGLLKEMRKNGAWRNWLDVFFKAVAFNADQLKDLILAVQQMSIDHQELIATWVRAPRHPYRLLQLLLAQPIMELPAIAKDLDITQRTAGMLAGKLKELGILAEITGQKRGRRFAYAPLLDLLVPPEESAEEATPS